MPVVSIVTPCYNAARYVGDTIASVRAQTFASWQMIVVDDGSSDGSAAAVGAVRAGEPRLELVRQQNGGVAAARQAGFARCDPGARYVLFLDADDVLAPTMLATLVDHLDRHEEAGLAYCDLRVVDETGTPRGSAADLFEPRWTSGRLGFPSKLPPDVVETPFVSVFCFAPIIPSAALLRRTVFERAGGWDPAFGQPVEDTDLYLRMALHADVHYRSQALVDYRRHSAQNTSDMTRLRAQNEKLRALWEARAKDDDFRPHWDTIRDALLFDRRRLAPVRGMRAARREMRHRHVRQAARFVGSGVRTALRSYG